MFGLKRNAFTRQNGSCVCHCHVVSCRCMISISFSRDVKGCHLQYQLLTSQGWPWQLGMFRLLIQQVWQCSNDKRWRVELADLNWWKCFQGPWIFCMGDCNLTRVPWILAERVYNAGRAILTTFCEFPKSLLRRPGTRFKKTALQKLAFTRRRWVALSKPASTITLVTSGCQIQLHRRFLRWTPQRKSWSVKQSPSHLHVALSLSLSLSLFIGL